MSNGVHENEQFKTEVFQTELEEINQRRNKVLPGNHPLSGSPSTRLGLVGLAFSGGGIRSATFNYGVLQALARNGMLKYVDYLSTVSGGGYIGSCLSSLLNQPGNTTEGETFPFHFHPGRTEKPASQYLRSQSNYLAPGGLLDELRIPALLLRGILLHFLTLLPYVAMAVLITRFGYGPQLNYALSAEHFSWESFYTLLPWSTLPLLILIVTFPILYAFRIRGISWKRRNRFELLFAVGLLLPLVVLLLESLPVTLAFYKKYWLDSTWGERWTWITGILSLIPFSLAGKGAERVSKLSGQIFLSFLGLLGPLILLLIYLRLGAWVIWGDTPVVWGLSPLLITVVAGGLIYLYTLFLVDANSTSLHSFYRDRLSKTYLISEIPPGYNVTQNDDQTLTDLNRTGTFAPYHLINGALNLQGSQDESLLGRNCDFFLFSKYFCGSERTGYCKTKTLEEIDPHLNLGTAMAISAAAASPNMGTATIKSLIFVMALLNIRLGYWLPNPYKVKQGYRSWEYHRISPFSCVGVFYLFQELLGLVNEKSQYVNVSDGGHIENLGVFELLHRKCKFIIVGDGEADPNLTFNGLATVIRYAKIDLGVEIEIDLDDVRQQANGYSHKHCAMGKIYYGNDEVGYLLYIKSSIVGDEGDKNEYIREYRSQNPTFPHETTADQFFDEAQFEAYRALGDHIVSELFEGMDVHQKSILESWFETLEPLLRPRSQMVDAFVLQQEQLGTIERLFLDSEIAEYTYQIYPELNPNHHDGLPIQAAFNLPSADETAAQERYRKIFHVCSLQMQLMENVYLALQLDKLSHRLHPFNRGWMNLFRRWAQAPLFRWTWGVSIGIYSVGFQIFCEEALKLRSKISWKLIAKQDYPLLLTPREQEHLEEQTQKGKCFSGQEAKTSQVWVANMVVQLTSGENARQEEMAFPVGFVIINLIEAGEPSKKAELVFCRIRDYYRQMRLLEKMIPTLKETLKKNCGESLEFQLQLWEKAEGINLRYRHFFKRYFEDTNEQAVPSTE